MGWDYVSELPPPACLLFIPNVACEHGEPWWNDTDRAKLMIRPPEISGNPTSSHLTARVRAKETMNLALRSIFVRTFQVTFLHAVKSYDMGFLTLLPLQRKVFCRFLSPWNIRRFGRVWTREPWSSGNHANRYITDATVVRCDSIAGEFTQTAQNTTAGRVLRNIYWST
jgi:hypothetical protein